MKQEIERLARAVGADTKPLDLWTAADWDVVATAFAGGASAIGLHGVTITREQWAQAERCWDEFRALQAAGSCGEIAAAAEARGFTSLAAAARRQAAEWRRKAEGQSSTEAAGGG